MNNDFESRRRKSYTQMRMIYDLTMAGLMIGMSVILFFGDKIGLDLIAGLDSLIRYGFGALCLLYGGFRVYRGIKHDY
ncbi:hypothetical protein [Parafilimonas sp.]|uniref:hypothetical protein n=1 Tax=Parafilimonas sp. TaxID=1969739 RepID=UPI0039E2C658